MREPLHKVAEHFGRRGVLVVISDFYEDPEEIVDAVTPLRFRGNDIVVFHVLDPAELEFGFTDAQAFEDLESGEQMPVVPDALRKEYVVAGATRTSSALQQRFSEVRVDYTLLDTSKPLDHALLQVSRQPREEDAFDSRSVAGRHVISSPRCSSSRWPGWPFRY